MNEQLVKWLPLILVLITGLFALQQIRSNNITASRLKWLENLRLIIADFFSECNMLIIKEGLSTGIRERINNEPNEKVGQFYNRINESMIDHLKAIEFKYDLIRLNLNPKEELHNKLESLLDDYFVHFNKLPSKKNDKDEFRKLAKLLDNHSTVLIQLCRFIFKLEWEKIKRPFISRMYYLFIGKGRYLLAEALNLNVKN